MLDALLLSHLAVQLGRIATAAFLFGTLYVIGAAVLRVEIADRTERLLLRVACGFAVYQFVVRWLGELPVMTRVGVWAITIVLAAVGGWRAMKEDHRIAPSFRPVVIFVLLLAPLAMALAPAVSQDALIYHLRFPEMTLREGRWAYDAANSSSYYPAATGTLYLAALALDAQGVTAQLVHFGFFILCIVAAGAIARRLGAPTGRMAMLLFAAVPCAGIVAGWAWADLSLLFAIAAAVLAAFGGLYVVAFALLGLAASIKYTALLVCIPIAIVMARRARPVLIGIALAALIASPWYVTNAIRTGNPVYPLASQFFGGAPHDAQDMVSNWSAAKGQSWIGVWSGYFLAPQTLDEDIGGVLFLAIAILGLTMAFASKLRVAAGTALAMWAVFLPMTPAVRLLLPAVAATLIVAGAALEARSRIFAIVVALFVARGALVTAAHNAHFMNPLPAAVGIEQEQHYLSTNFPPAALYARIDGAVPRDARFVAINEVRLFRFPRPVSASRVLDPPLLARYIENARSAEEIVARFHADRVTHLLIAPKPIERGPLPHFSPQANRLFNIVIRRSRVIDHEGSTLVLELPAG